MIKRMAFFVLIFKEYCTIMRYGQFSPTILSYIFWVMLVGRCAAVLRGLLPDRILRIVYFIGCWILLQSIGILQPIQSTFYLHFTVCFMYLTKRCFTSHLILIGFTFYGRIIDYFVSFTNCFLLRVIALSVNCFKS